jgi:TolB protein
MKSTAFALLLSFFLTATGLAQSGDVREYTIDTLMTTGFEPTPIGVDDMDYIGHQYITANDSTYMAYVTTVVQRDLDFYADFELIPIDSFFLKTYEITDLDLLGWRRLGADYVVKLEAEFPGANMRVRWRLFDVLHSQRIARGQFEYNRTFWREIGHDIANEIVHTLTGNRGIFRTRIVYVKKLGKAKELFMADYDGANERQLTNTGSINVSPAFAPNREEVYFTSYMDGYPQLYKVDIVSGVITKIGDFDGLVAAPSVAPDGRKIACVIAENGNSDIYVLDLEGRVIKRLTRSASIESSPTWSPDSRFIAFSSDRTGSPQVYVMDADGLGTRRLTFQGGYNDSPLWSMRGDRITFVSRTRTGRFNLASIDTSGADYRILTELGTNENPHFSPDGKHIVFSSTRLGGIDIYTMDVSGRNQRRLTRQTICSNPAWGPLR